MKKTVYLLLAAAMTLAACTVESAPESDRTDSPETFIPGPSTFTVTLEENPATKATLGLNGSGKPQTFWENGDAISVFTSADGTNPSGKSYKFSTTLGANATSAEFSYDDEGEFGSGSYFASYPYRNHTRGVNFTAYRMAGNIIPNTQTLVAGDFDRNAMLAVAYTESGNSLSFKNAVALIKFRVAESDIVAGRIEVDEGDAISGTFRADFVPATGEVSLETYTGAASYNFVNFSLGGGAPLSTDTDYYVAVRPLTLTSGLNIFLNGKLVKSISAGKLASLQRNRIYNLGTLSTPATPARLVLPFDFSGEALGGWPTADKWKTSAGELDCTYPLYGTNYHFFLTDCGNASQARVAWVANGLVLYSTWRYVGLPAIAGYKLVKVKGTMSLGTNTKRKAAIVKNVAADNTAGTIAELHEFVTGGESTGWTNNGTVYTFNLSGTEANTMYYFLCTNTSVGVSDLTLTYEPM